MDGFTVTSLKRYSRSHRSAKSGYNPIEVIIVRAEAEYEDNLVGMAATLASAGYTVRISGSSEIDVR